MSFVPMDPVRESLLRTRNGSQSPPSAISSSPFSTNNHSSSQCSIDTDEPESGNVIVRVRAQVMNRDDSKGGWVPKGKGGFVNVSVRKKKIIHHEDSHCRYEYQIYGKTEKETVLNCPIKKDFVYHKVMPAFHHWESDNMRLGLTFQTASEARTFDQGIHLAMGDLFEEKSLACPHKRYRDSKSKGLSGSDISQFNALGDDDVFMQLDLPVEKGPTSTSESPIPFIPGSSVVGRGHNNLSRVTSTSPPPLSDTAACLPTSSHDMTATTTSSASGSQSAVSKQHLDQEIRLLLRTIDMDAAKKKKKKKSEESKKPQAKDKDYSYVKFPTRPLVHEYSYPAVNNDSNKGKLQQQKGEGFKSSKGSNKRKGGSPQLPIRKSTSGFLSSKSSWLFGGFSGTQSSNSSSSSPPNLSEGGGSLDHHLRKQPPFSYSSSPPKRGLTSSSPEYPESLLRVGSDNEGIFGGPEANRMSMHCVHCRESFSHSQNFRGSCPDAPDKGARALEWITGVRCAEGVLYHCTSDSDGDYVHPCKCSNSDGHCLSRWCGMSLLSVLLPCLCLYPPLWACYRCGRACRICGGRHQTAEEHFSK